MKKLFLPFLLGMIAFCPSLYAQSLKDHEDFFKQQQPVFQRWLDQEGLGEYMSVEGLEVYAGKLRVYMDFPFAGPQDVALDSFFTAYKNVKKQYDSGQPLTMEQRMFYKLCFIMEVKPADLRIFFFDTYDQMQYPLYFDSIHFDQGIVLSPDTASMKTRYKKLTVPIDLKTRASREKAKITLDEDQNRQIIYEEICAFIKEKYPLPEKGSGCAFDLKNRVNGKPYLELSESEEVLSFIIYDLKEEVLTNLPKSTVCELLDILGFECDIVRREMLGFTITYKELKEGAEIQIILDGKIGSGLYETDLRKGYHDMEDDFDHLFDPYSRQLERDLKTYLNRK